MFSTGSSRRRQRGCTAAGLAEPWISLLIRDGRLVPVRSDTVLRAGDEAVVLSTDPEVAGFRVDGVVGPQTWQALVSEALSG